MLGRLFGSSRQTTQVGANRKNLFTGNGSGGAEGTGGYEFFLSYPLTRAPNAESEDSFLIQSVQYKHDPTGTPGARKFVKTGTGADGENFALWDNSAEGGTRDAKVKEGTNIVTRDKEGNLNLSMGGGMDARLNAHRGDGAQAFAKETNFYVELPIPKQVNDGNAVQWGANSMNLFTLAGLDLANNAIQSPKGALDDLQGVYDALVRGGDFQDLGLEGNEEIQNSVRASMASLAINVFNANVTPNSVMSRALGKILNGNKELLFDGVSLREFKFDFTFTPRSQDESARAKKIIRQLKRSMAPKAGQGYQGAEGTIGAFSKGAGIFLNSPDLFLLRYLSGGEDHPFLNAFKPCALTSLSVNYTGGGTYSTYMDGTPVHMKVSMVFKETNPVYNEDYLNENVPGDGF